MHCNSITLPLKVTTYISHDIHDQSFGELLYTKSVWSRTTLAFPDYTPEKLREDLEQALYTAHTYQHTQPCCHILILPDWTHTLYLAHNLHTSYAQN
jgi:hypothetical protein